MLRSLLKQPITPVWGGLIAITAFSYWLGTNQGTSDHKVATVALMAVAFTKVRFVGMYFMELRGAPLPLKLLFQGWCVVVCCAVLTLYLAGG